MLTSMCAQSLQPGDDLRGSLHIASIIEWITRSSELKDRLLAKSAKSEREEDFFQGYIIFYQWAEEWQIFRGVAPPEAQCSFSGLSLDALHWCKRSSFWRTTGNVKALVETPVLKIWGRSQV